MPRPTRSALLSEAGQFLETRQFASVSGSATPASRRSAGVAPGKNGTLANPADPIADIDLPKLLEADVVIGRSGSRARPDAARLRQIEKNALKNKLSQAVVGDGAQPVRAPKAG
jgi:hypothetical protein